MSRIRRLRVVLIDLWEGPGHWHYTGSLSKALTDEGAVDLELFLNSQQQLTHFGDNVTIHPVLSPTRFTPNQIVAFLVQPFVVIRLLLLLAKARPNVIHLVFGHPWTSVLLPLLTRFCPVVATLHDITPHHGENHWRNKLSIWAIVSFARRIIVHGPSSLREAQSRYPKRSDGITSIPHGNFSYLCRPRAQAATQSNRNFLLFGRLLRYKGIDLALTALRLVRAEFPDATLTLAGDGDLTPYRRLIAESGDSVQIINRRISDEEAAVIFQSCLCVLAPYTHASASGVIMTAFAYSKAVIVSALPGLLDMVTDGESGLVVPPGDTAALAASMKRLLNDPEEALRLGVGGNAYSVRECSWARIAATHIAEYQRAYDEFPHSHGRGKT